MAQSDSILHTFLIMHWNKHALIVLAMEIHAHIWDILPCCIEQVKGILNMQMFCRRICQK